MTWGSAHRGYSCSPPANKTLSGKPNTETYSDKPSWAACRGQAGSRQPEQGLCWTIHTQHTKCIGMCSLNACHVLKERGSLLWQNCSTVCWESLVEVIEPHHLTEETDYGFLNSNNTLYGWPWIKEWSRNNFNPSVNPHFVLLAFENCKQSPLQNSLEYRTLGLAASLWWEKEGELCSEANLSPREWSTFATHYTATTAAPFPTACLSQGTGCWYMHSRTWPAVSSISMETTSSSMVAWWRYVDSKIRTHLVKCIKKE